MTSQLNQAASPSSLNSLRKKVPWGSLFVEDLEKSCIDSDSATANQLRVEGDRLYFPYLDLDGKPMQYIEAKGKAKDFERWKYARSTGGSKYGQPTNSGVKPYFPAESRSGLKEQGGEIFITEGEKKAICLAKHGLTAIGLGGVYNFKPKDAEKLCDELERINWENRNVWIVFDREDSSQKKQNVKGAACRLSSLLRKAGAKKVGIVELPGGKDGKQGIDDYLAKEKRRKPKRVMKAKWLSQHLQEFVKTPYGTLADLEEQIGEQEWLIDNFVPKGLITLVIAEPKVGKSAFVLHAIARPILTGENWFTGQSGSGEAQYILWCDTEGSMPITTERCRKWGIPRDRIGLLDPDNTLRPLSLESKADIALLEQRIVDFNAPLVVIDSLRGAHSEDENSSKVVKLIEPLYEVAARTKTAIVVIHHTGKIPEGKRVSNNSSRGSNAIVAAGRMVIGIDKPEPNRKLAIARVLPNNLTSSEQEVEVGFEFKESGLEYTHDFPEPVPTNVVDGAIRWLKNYMQPGTWYCSKEIIENGVNAGYSRSSVMRARDKLGTETKKKGNAWMTIRPLHSLDS